MAGSWGGGLDLLDEIGGLCEWMKLVGMDGEGVGEEE